jgi:hypothetical protein
VTFLLACLAVWRLYHLAAKDIITEPLRARIHKRATPGYGKVPESVDELADDSARRKRWRWFRTGFLCPWCASIWWAAITWPLWQAAGWLPSPWWASLPAFVGAASVTTAVGELAVQALGASVSFFDAYPDEEEATRDE